MAEGQEKNGGPPKSSLRSGGGVLLLDGGLATELESRGHTIHVRLALVYVFNQHVFMNSRMRTIPNRVTLSGARGFCTLTPRPS